MIQLSTRTPLWTGGVDGTTDRLHETGILGSLRWWYEAIVRGLGGTACDPSQHTCNFDDEKYRKSRAPDEHQRLRDAGLCDVCQVFGATGWKRQFQLEASLTKGEIDVTEGMWPSGRIYPDRRGYRAGGWLLRGGYHGELILRFTGDPHILCCEILPTLRLMEQWGALGAKTSLGYGVFQIEQVTLDGASDVEESCPDLCATSPVGAWWWKGTLPSEAQPYTGILPALSNMFFAKVRFRPEDPRWWQEFPEVRWLVQESIPKDEAIWVGEGKSPSGPYNIRNPLPADILERWYECNHHFPLAPILRNFLRYKLICDNGESDWCKFLFGTVRGKTRICGYCGHSVREDNRRSGNWWCGNGKVSLLPTGVVREGKRIQSKIRVSWAYKTESEEWEFRIWGWLPRNPSHQGIPDVVSAIREWLAKSSLEVESPTGGAKVILPTHSFHWWPDSTELLDQTKLLEALERLRQGGPGGVP